MTKVVDTGKPLFYERFKLGLFRKGSGMATAFRAAACAILLITIPAAASSQDAAKPAAPAEAQVPSLGAALVTGVKNTLTAHPNTAFEPLLGELEMTVQRVLEQGDATPETARSAILYARQNLSEEGLHCQASRNPQEQRRRCDAVRIALQLALTAVEEAIRAQAAGVRQGGAAFPPPPSAGGGGAGGGVTHPRVAASN